MKILKTISVITVAVILLTSMQIFAFGENCADGCTHHDHEVEVILHNEVSEETSAKIIAHFSGEGEPEASVDGLICTLLGHNLEYGNTSVITHKVRSTAPRCLKEVYDYALCTRCDYSDYDLISSGYIYCCS